MGRRSIEVLKLIQWWIEELIKGLEDEIGSLKERLEMGTPIKILKQLKLQPNWSLMITEN